MTTKAKETTVPKARQATTPPQDETPPATKPERKLLARCPEFACYEVPNDEPEEPGLPKPPPYYRLIEATPEIDEALLKAGMRTTDAGDESTKGERLPLAKALRTLAEFTSGHGTDEKALLSDLAATLGKMVLSVMETPTKTRRVSPERKRELANIFPDQKPANICHSPRDTFKSAEVAAIAVGTKVGGAVTSIARWKFTPQDWNRIRAIIFEAKTIFRETLTRPTKFQIRETLEEDGDLLTGKDTDGRWREAFTAAGLGTLPD